MVFSSLQFVLIFMPVFFTCYYLSPARIKNVILFLGSLSFYFIGTLTAPYHFVIFIVSILLDFAVGLGIERYTRLKRPLLIFGVALHLIALSLFKYTGFVTGEISKLFPNFNASLNIILPIGISFYTFQGISYIADVYRGSIKAEKSLLCFTVYISMFEQLIAGPIVTYSQVKNELHARAISANAALRGLATFIFGLGLKVLLANPVGKLWSQAEAIGFESLSTPLAWLAVIAYSLQIYFDFFGYSLMAVGLGKMLGFNLPQNFNHPYTSLTMTEFWRRWHITLGAWFREYVYIPLGGNKNGNFRTVLNLLIVWLLTGIWHGAGYSFILWGFVLFVIIAIEKLFLGDFLRKRPIIGHLYMAVLIPVTWSIFAVEDISSLWVLLGRLFPFFGQGVWSVFKYDFVKYLTQYFPFLLVGILLSLKTPYKQLMCIKSKAVIAVFLLAVFSASVYCMYRGLDDPFLYFRF